MLLFFFFFLLLPFDCFDVSVVLVWRRGCGREKPNQNSRSLQKNFDTSLFDSNALKRVSAKNLP